MLTIENVSLTRTTAPRLRAGVALELLKPVTWFPPMWAFACGVVAASGGTALRDRWPLVAGGALLAGPLVCGTTQVVNDWFDRHVDALNEPRRAIPSGRAPGTTALTFAAVWGALSIAVASALGPWGVGATVLALLLGWAYSAPPLRLKRNGWLGNAAVGISYEGLAWITGALVAAGGALPGPRTLALALLYSAGAHGIMTLNDFKSEQGDRTAGVASLPVLLGAGAAARVASLVMLLPQMLVVMLLVYWGASRAAGIVLALMLVQGPMMLRFVRRPTERALGYSAFGVPLYVAGMMAAAFGLRAIGGGQ